MQWLLISNRMRRSGLLKFRVVVSWYTNTRNVCKTLLQPGDIMCGKMPSICGVNDDHNLPQSRLPYLVITSKHTQRILGSYRRTLRQVPGHSWQRFQQLNVRGLHLMRVVRSQPLLP